jgi:hypothetical protein
MDQAIMLQREEQDQKDEVLEIQRKAGLSNESVATFKVCSST